MNPSRAWCWYLSSGNNNKSSINFFDNVFTFHNESVTVNCCHENNTLELAACGLGASCAGACSALGAVLCPSGNCSGSCEMPFEEEEETKEATSRGFSSGATKPSKAYRWCSPRCNVWKTKGCCYNPNCKRKDQKNAGGSTSLQVILSAFELVWISICSGNTCPLPGSLQNGNWSCQLNELPVFGTSFLDEDAQTYPGEYHFCPWMKQLKACRLLPWKHLLIMNYSSTVPAGLRARVCCSADSSYHLCQRRIWK